MASAIGSKTLLIAERDSLEIVMAGPWLAGEAEDGAFALGDLAERLGAQGGRSVSRPTRRLSTSPAARRRLRWWLTSGWRQADVRDELA